MMEQINFESFDRICATCEKYIGRSDEYISSISKLDKELSIAIFSNEYVNCIGELSEFLLNELLGEDLADHLRWYLYTWEPGFSIKSPSGTEYTINNREEFLVCTKELFKNVLVN